MDFSVLSKKIASRSLKVNRKKVWVVSLLVGLGILIGVSRSRVDADTDDSEQIKQLSSDYATALLSRDTKFLASVIAPDEVNVGTDGRPFDRAALLAKINDPSFSYKKIDIDGLEIRVVGSMALSRGMATVTSETSGHRATDNFRFVRIWERQADKWQVIYFQATHFEVQKLASSGR
jgi:ketosteroid isomerase-like protein